MSGPFGFDPFGDGAYGELAPGELQDTPFLRFIADDRQRMRFLVEITGVKLGEGYLGYPIGHTFADEPYGAIPGDAIVLFEKTFLFGDGIWIGRPGDTKRKNRAADARVIASADLERVLPLAPENERRGEVAVGEIELANPDGGLDELVSSYSIAGREVVVLLGPARGTSQDFRVVAQMFGVGFETDLNTVKVRVQSTQALLTPSLHQRVWSGAGGIDGDPELAERRAPVCLGECFNISPVLFNKDQWIYAVHDGPILAVDAFKERGLPLDWSGTDVSTYGALRSASVAGGEYTTCKALGLVKAGFDVGGPTGPVTADIRGDRASGVYINDIGGILSRIATRRAGMDPALIDLIGFANLPTGPLGFYADGASDISCSAVFDALLRSINGWYGTRRERTLRVGYIVPPERFTAARRYNQNSALSLERLPVDQPPRYAQAVTWGKNWTVMSASDISEALDSDTRLRLQLAGNTLRKRSVEVRTRDRTAIDGGTLETFFVEEDDAQEVLDRVMALFRESRRQYRMRVPRIGYLVDLQTIASLSHPREGLAAGRNFIVSGIRDDGRRGQVELTLWG